MGGGEIQGERGRGKREVGEKSRNSGNEPSMEELEV